MPFISQSSIQEVKDRLDAVALANDYLRIEKRGGRFWACCPFHQEKTASFTVNPELKIYHCFGCHKSGSMINFVMEMDKLSFPEAIEHLAKKFGVELAYDSSGENGFSPEEEAKKKEKMELFELYRRISGTFHHFLQKNQEAEEIKHYILARGIKIEMVERFGLGFSPADRYWLHNFLSQKGYSNGFLAASGLFSSRHNKVSLFAGRLIFPIADRQGRTVAFGGRLIQRETVNQRLANQKRDEVKRLNAEPPPSRDGWEPPKYINSPELGIYKKGETLYAIDLALPEIRRTKTAYIAEGYIDVIALHQAGITNAVAPLGTAFTDEQAKLLKRWAERIVFFFDSDEAGQTAAIKGIYTCRKNGLACAVVAPGKQKAGSQTPGSAPHSKVAAHINITKKMSPEAVPPKDPADILKDYGPEALQSRAKAFIGDFEYLLLRARLLYDVSNSGAASVQRKAQAVAFIFPYIDLLDSEVARASCFEVAADAFALLPAQVAEDYRRHVSGQAPVERKEETMQPIRINDELLLLIAVAANFASSGGGAFFSKFRAALEINEIEDKSAKELFIALEECIRYGETGMDELLARISSTELKKIIMARSASGEFSVNSEQLVSDGINKIKIKRLEHRQEEIIIKLRSSKKKEDRDTDEKELLAEKMRIDNELYKLRQGR